MKKLSVTMTHREKLWGWIYYPIQLLLLPFLISFANAMAGNPLNEAKLNFVYFLVNFLVIWVIFFHFLKDNGKNALHQPLDCLRFAAVGLIINWGLSYAVQLLIAAVSPDFFNVNDASINDMAKENFNLMAVGTVLLVPVAEEALYRGLIFGQLYNRSRFAAYAVSILVFAAIHVIGYIGMYQPLQLVLCLLQYLPAGIALGWAYAKSDTIWAPILIHIFNNWLAVSAMR